MEIFSSHGSPRAFAAIVATGIAAISIVGLVTLGDACTRHEATSAETTAYTTSALLGSFNVLTRCYDNTQDCANVSETTLSQDKVGGGGKPIPQMQANGRIFAQPLYASSVNLDGGATHNVLYIATMNNALYAFDADTGTQLWSKSYSPAGYAPPTSAQVGGGCRDLSIFKNGPTGNVGIEGTPVIDPTAGTIYFVTPLVPTDGGLTMTYWLHAVDMTNGTDRSGSPVQIATTGFNELYQHQRAALALNAGYVYVAFASYCDNVPPAGMYHGYVFAFNTSSLGTPPNVFNSTPTITSAAQCDAGDPACGAGIWQAGAGPVIDSSGNLYYAIGNGRYDGTNFGDSVVKLASQSLAFDAATSNYFTPQDYLALEQGDLDLGVAAPSLLPEGGGKLVQGGKEGVLYLLNPGNLGGKGTNCSTCTSSCSPPCFDAGGNGNGVIATVLWINPQGTLNLYAWVGNTLEAFQYNGSTFNSTPAHTWGTTGGGFISLSANGSVSGTGILWDISPGAQTSRTLYAINAENLTTLWSTSVGNVPNFTPPLVAHGAVYVLGPDVQGDDAGYVQGYTFPCTTAHPYNSSCTSGTGCYDPGCSECIPNCTGPGWNTICCMCQRACGTGYTWSNSCCTCCKNGQICCSNPPP